MKLFRKLISLALVLMLCGAAVPAARADDMLKIGIAQFAEHGSLDNCRLGFIEGLKEMGYEEGVNVTFLYQNANTSMASAAQIADIFIAQGCDMIAAIATPMAQAAATAADRTGVPVVYAAVSAPVESMLAEADGRSTLNVTGTSDALPVAAQLSLIRELMPEAKRIGIMYTTSEVNSVYQLAEYERLAPEYGFEIVQRAVSEGAEIALALPGLLRQADCLSMLTDNTVVSYLATVLDAAGHEGVPVFGSEVEQVAMGCVAAEGLDYVALGRETGRLAARVLGGEPAGDIAFLRVTEPALYVNRAACTDLGLVPGDALFSRAAEIFEE